MKCKFIAVPDQMFCKYCTNVLQMYRCANVVQLKSSLLPVGDRGEREANYVSFSGSGAPLLSSIDNVVQMSSYVLFSNAVQMFANVVQMYSWAPVQMFYSLVLVHSSPVLSPSIFFVTRSRSCVF